MQFMVPLCCRETDPQKQKRIAVTMYGVTTPGVTRTKQYLEENGYEVIVFHARNRRASTRKSD